MPTESLRSPFTYPNFLLKSPGLGGSYRLPNSNFFFCEQTKQFFACQNSSGSANTASTIEMVNSFKQKEIGSEISDRMQTGDGAYPLLKWFLQLFLYLCITHSHM